MMRDDINIFLSTEILIQDKKNVILQVNSIGSIIKIREDLQ